MTDPGRRQGILVEVQRRTATVRDADGTETSCAYSPEIRLAEFSNFAVGDAVEYFPGDASQEPLVTAILPRASKISRPGPGERHARELILAANVDLLVVVAAAAQPAFNARLLDRYLAVAERFGVMSLPTVLVLGAMLALGDLDRAWGQAPPPPPPAQGAPPMQGLEQLTPEERAVAERNLQRWQRLTPEERARALENYRRWQSMTPEERESARQNYRRFRQLRPDERAQILKDFQRWNELPKERQEELQKAYERYQRLPQERRDQLQQRLGRWESMTPEERERVLRNHERWRQMSPEQREQLRERWRQMPPEERERWRQQRQQQQRGSQ